MNTPTVQLATRRTRTSASIFALLLALSLLFSDPLRASQPAFFDRAIVLPPIIERAKLSKSVLKEYGRLPIGFERNEGQATSPVKFLARGDGYGLFLTANEAIIATINSAIRSGPVKSRVESVSMGFQGGNPAPQIETLEELAGQRSYILGAKAQNWRTNVRTYGRVRYQDVYDGVDVIYYSRSRQLEFDFVIAPRANPEVIRFTLRGSHAPHLDGSGNLIVRSEGSDLVFHAPQAYQLDGEVRRPVNSRFVISRDEIAFQLDSYNKDRELIIDPVLTYSTYLGGTGFSSADDETVNGITVDGAGNAYVVGSTVSSDFPVVNAFKTTGGGFLDAFVTKLNSAGSALVYSTYLGGDRRDEGRGIAVDANGSAYVTGVSASSDFPTTPGAFQTSGLDTDVFVTKLNASGNGLVYSTLLSGDRTVLPAGGGTLASAESGYAIAVNSSGEAFVAGETQSSNFPTANAVQSTGAGGFDAFVTKLKADGSGILFSTYLGGTTTDRANAIALDSAGSAYVAGETYSLDFPTTANAYKTTRTNSGVSIGFVAKFSSAGTAIYSTYIGDTFERVNSIAVNGSGEAFIVGETQSQNFPTTANALKKKPAQGAVFKSTNRSLSWSNSGYTGDFSVNAVALDPSNSANVYAGTQGGLFRSTDGGTSWTLIGLSGIVVLSVAADPNNPNVLLAGTSGQGLFKSNDSGNSWTHPIVSGNVFTLIFHPQISARVYAGVTGGGLQSSDDGDTWTAFGSGGTIRAIAFAPDDPNTIYVAASTGIIKTTDNGTNWTNVFPQSSTFGSIVIDPSNSAIVYAGHRTFGLFKSTNAGQNWSPLFAPNNQILTLAIDASTTPTTVYVCSADTGVYKSTDAGLNWTPTGLAYSSVNSLAIDRLSPTNLYSGSSVASSIDAFFTQLNSTGSSLMYSTYIGGSGYETAYGVAVTANGDAVIVGSSGSVDLPLAGALQQKTGVALDGFVTVLNTSSSTIGFSTYFGGSGIDRISAVAVDLAGNIYIGGHTRSADLPTVAAFQPSLKNIYDGFVAKITTSPPPQLILEQSGPAIDQATALDALLRLRDPFHVTGIAGGLNLSPDQNTRVLVFVSNLMLNPGETASAVTVNLVDSNSIGHIIPAEDVRAVPNSSFVQVTFRLPDGLPSGTCSVTVTAHGQVSNSGRFRIAP